MDAEARLNAIPAGTAAFMRKFRAFAMIVIGAEELLRNGALPLFRT